KRHVSDDFVGQIVRNLIAGYFPQSARESFKLDLHGRKGHRPTADAVAEGYRQLDNCGDDGAAMARILSLLMRTEDPATLMGRLDACLERLPGNPDLLALRKECAKRI